MNTWDVTVTVDATLPDEGTLHEIIAALPGGTSAGRSPWSDHLRVGVVVRAVSAVDAGPLAVAFVDHALATAGVAYEDGRTPFPWAVEVLHDDEAERRDVERDPFAGLIGADEAADILGITPSAVRQRAEQLGGQRVAGTWLFLRPAIEAQRRTR